MMPSQRTFLVYQPYNYPLPPTPVMTSDHILRVYTEHLAATPAPTLS